MAQLYFRSFNPVWNFRDLTGLPLDDTYYAFFLENTIPYQPQAVYHQPNGIPWNSPIQLTAAGTLPVDVYFDPDLVYRIEIRAGDTQADALIWLIENYTPDGSGGGTIDSTAITSGNQITNPQFALINFESPLSLSSSGTYNIAPGWDLVLTGSGTANLTHEALTSTTSPNPTNAPYALRLALNGWSTAYLRQRFEQNGVLWANLSVSNSVTARANAVSTTISATLFDSNNTQLATLLPNTTTLDSQYTEFTNGGTLIASTNTDVPPSAYIEYRLNLQGTSDVYVTSIQIVASVSTEFFNYEQTSINRQIDQTYNVAYPIVPVGAIIDYGGFGIPLHYLDCNGDAINRITYSLLFHAVSTTETVTLTSGLNTFTVADGSIYRIGMGLEGTGIPGSTTISNISGTTITMSSNATASGEESVRFFATGKPFTETVTLTSGSPAFTVASAANYLIGMRLTGTGIAANTVISNIVGTTITMNNNATATTSSLVTFYSAGNGDGSTTFNLYDLRDYVIAGVGGSLFGATNNGIGNLGGSATHSITANELPPHTHPADTGGTSGVGSSIRLASGTGAGTTGSNVTTHNAIPLVQQTALMRKIIRYE